MDSTDAVAHGQPTKQRTIRGGSAGSNKCEGVTLMEYENNYNSTLDSTSLSRAM
jgi:hypothetical protein